MRKLIPLFILSICIYLSFNAIRHPKNLFWSDMEGYYMYLPSVFIHGEFKKEAVVDTNYLREYPGTDKVFSKYTCGVAILEMPFFLQAHLLSKIAGWTADGHTEIYANATMLAGVFYMLAGMYLLYTLLLEYFNKKITALVLMSLLFGTNLYYYTFFQPGMSHVYSFFLFAGLMWLVRKIQTNKQTNKYFVLLGLVSSLIVLVRPTNIIVLLLPAYIWVKQCEDKWLSIRKNLPALLIAALTALIPWSLQCLYWKHVTGSWFMWSYGTESFQYWQEPKLIKVLFGAWNGWLLYSPIVILPLIGLFIGRNTNKYHERIIIVILAISTYIFGSWWAWWFGGAFGHRSYVEYYALLAIPFGSFATYFFSRKWTTILLAMLCALGIYYNLGLTYNYQAPWDGANWTYESWWKEVLKLF